MRLTYKILAQLVSDKLKSLEVCHDEVEAYNPRYSSNNIECGACLIHFNVITNYSRCSLYGFQWRKEIEEIINSGKYIIKITPKNYGFLTDSEVSFVKLLPHHQFKKGN
jgi:hypothetical protein